MPIEKIIIVLLLFLIVGSESLGKEVWAGRLTTILNWGLVNLPCNEVIQRNAFTC